MGDHPRAVYRLLARRGAAVAYPVGGRRYEQRCREMGLDSLGCRGGSRVMRQRPSGRKITLAEKAVLLPIFQRDRKQQINEAVEAYLTSDRDCHEVATAYGVRANSIARTMSRLRKKAREEQPS